MGELRDDLGRAPIVGGVHNFISRRDFIPEDLSDPWLEWGDSNVERSYTVLAQLESRFASKPVSVLFKHGGLVRWFHKDHIVFYGTEGAIYIKGHYGSGNLYVCGNQSSCGAPGGWHYVGLLSAPASSSRDLPGCRLSSDHGPIPARTSLSVG